MSKCVTHVSYVCAYVRQVGRGLINTVVGATAMGMQPKFKMLEYAPAHGRVENNMFYKYSNTNGVVHKRSVCLLISNT